MITNYNAPPRAMPGMTMHSFQHEFISRALAAQQLEELTFGTADGTYKVTINGSEVASFAAVGKTATEIRDAVKALLDASAAPVTAISVSTNKLHLHGAEFTATIPTIAGYSKSQLIAPGQAVGFGLGLVVDDAAPVSGRRCRLPCQPADVSRFLGIAHGDTSLPDTGKGWAPGSMVSILRRGHIWVVVENAVAELAPLFCRFAAGAGGTVLGAFRSDADGGSAGVVGGLRALEACSGAGAVPAALT